MKRRLATWSVACIAIPLFGYLLYRQLEQYSLDEVIASVTSIPLANMLLAGAAAAASYLCLTGFDAMAVRYAGYRFPYRKVALASFVSLSIGHNIGIATLSTGAIRYRFYSKLGMTVGDAGKVILFCGLTVALGLLSLGGIALLINPTLAADILGLGRPAIAAFIGAGCLLLIASYVAAAACVRRPLHLHKWTLEMPTLRLALGQVTLGPLNFACVAGCLYFVVATLADVGYAGVATAYVIGNAAGLVSHVPGGLGVLEGVVMFLLPGGDVIGALLAFRCIYFFIPLALGGPLFALIEFGRLFRDRLAAESREAA
jgi:uncharacterized membrane protein YbhN (UPF0104 family)